MKSLIFTVLSFLSITSNGQSIASNTNTNTDLIVDIPMIGNIKINNCDEKLMQALKMFTIMKVINKTEAIKCIINDNGEESYAISLDQQNEHEKQITELLQ